MFEINTILSQKNDIYTSAYHYFSSESTGKSQADNFIRTISICQLDLPPVLDIEIKQKAIDRESLIKETTIFLKEVEESFGVRPLIYTTYETYNAFLKDDFDGYQLWFRDLFKEPKIDGNRDWLFWQYCNRGRVKGIGSSKNFVDLNVFNGTENDLDIYVANLHIWKLAN